MVNYYCELFIIMLTYLSLWLIVYCYAYLFVIIDSC